LRGASGQASGNVPDPLFTGVNHVGIVTSDLDRAVRTWWDRYGVGPWRFFTYAPDTMDVEVDGRHEEFGMRVAVCHLDASTRLELIQPLDDRGPHARSLAAHGGADHLHHLRLDVDDYAGALGRLRGLEVSEILSGRFRGRGRTAVSTATYADTGTDLGFIVEIAELPAGAEMPEPDYTYPAQDAPSAATETSDP
jgi:hypothetical protein